MAKAEVKIKDKTKGAGIAGVLKRTQDAALKVGLLKGLGIHPNSEGMTIPEVGAVNEFGGGNVPERSFIRSTIRENVKKYSEVRKELLAKIITGNMTLDKAVNILGTMVKSDIQKMITDLKDPPNAPRTVEEKGSSNPLIDTGLLRKSIQWEKL